MVKPRSFKLIYFDVQWRCEPIRILFHYFGQEFEDMRITNDEWQQMKPGGNSSLYEQLLLSRQIVSQRGKSADVK